jgi:hypothetical protein
MIADENSEAGKKQFAMLLTAQARGSVVILKGMNTCNRWADGEDIDEILLLDWRLVKRVSPGRTRDFDLPVMLPGQEKWYLNAATVRIFSWAS